MYSINILREKDTITLSAKITNLTNNRLSGIAKLILTDAISGKEINEELQNLDTNKSFNVDKDGNNSSRSEEKDTLNSSFSFTNS